MKYEERKKLLEKAEEIRTELELLMESKKDFLDEEVIEKSRQLDEILVICSKEINKEENVK